MLFSPQRPRRPGPKGPDKELINAVVVMKRRNPNWGCPRIAQQIALAFGVEIDKDVVRRILSVHYRPGSDSEGPSWLTFLGHTKDSLWSCDLFRCESATLRTHWVLVVMDQFTRRIVGFGVHCGIIDGLTLCRIFQRVVRKSNLPEYLSSDHDPLYRFHQWQANLRVLGVTEIKTVPYVPLSHPFVERLIGTVRREYLGKILFWTRTDLEAKLIDFQHYFNAYRTHAGLEGRCPNRVSTNLHHLLTSPPTDGEVTVKGCTRLPPHDLSIRHRHAQRGIVRLDLSTTDFCHYAAVAGISQGLDDGRFAQAG